MPASIIMKTDIIHHVLRLQYLQTIHTIMVIFVTETFTEAVNYIQKKNWLGMTSWESDSEIVLVWRHTSLSAPCLRGPWHCKGLV